MSLLSLFRKSQPAAAVEPQPETPLQAVSIAISGKHFNWRLQTDAPLDRLSEALIDSLRGTDLGELTAVECVDKSPTAIEAAIIYLRGPDADQLFAHVRPVLEQHPIASGARVGIDLDLTTDDLLPRTVVNLRTAQLHQSPQEIPRA